MITFFLLFCFVLFCFLSLSYFRIDVDALRKNKINVVPSQEREIDAICSALQHLKTKKDIIYVFNFKKNYSTCLQGAFFNSFVRMFFLTIQSSTYKSIGLSSVSSSLRSKFQLINAFSQLQIVFFCFFLCTLFRLRMLF